MKRYAMFNEGGRSMVITNQVPEGEEGNYCLVPEAVTGSLLVKEGNKIRDLSAKESEAIRVQMLVDFFTKEVRAKRNKLLAAADVLTLPDRWESYSEARKKKVSAYKQALRDIPKQKGFPKDVTFPEIIE